MPRPGRLQRHQIVLVTGKGGTGKTTISTALAVASAAADRATLLLETHGARQVAGIFGQQSAGYALQTLAPGLRCLSLSAEDCVQEFVVRQVRFQSIYRAVFRNRIMAPFMDAVPGLPDLIQMGKIYDLAEGLSADVGRPDRIVVDAPATGHGLTMLHSPAAMMKMTTKGPFHANAARVHEVFSDIRRSALVLVCLPSPLAVNETIELYQRLGEAQHQVACCVLNQVLPTPVDDGTHLATLMALRTRCTEPQLVETLQLAERWSQMAAWQTSAQERLADALPVPLVPIPRFLDGLTLQDLLPIGQRIAGHLADRTDLAQRAWGPAFPETRA